MTAFYIVMIIVFAALAITFGILFFNISSPDANVTNCTSGPCNSVCGHDDCTEDQCTSSDGPCDVCGIADCTTQCTAATGVCNGSCGISTPCPGFTPSNIPNADPDKDTGTPGITTQFVAGFFDNTGNNVMASTSDTKTVRWRVANNNSTNSQFSFSMGYNDPSDVSSVINVIDTGNNASYNWTNVNDDYNVPLYAGMNLVFRHTNGQLSSVDTQIVPNDDFVVVISGQTQKIQTVTRPAFAS